MSFVPSCLIDRFDLFFLFFRDELGHRHDGIVLGFKGDDLHTLGVTAYFRDILDVDAHHDPIPGHDQQLVVVGDRGDRDDAQMSTNYPLVRFTSMSLNVFYARTYNWSSAGVMTGTTPVSTEFVLPAGLPIGLYSVVAVAKLVSEKKEEEIEAINKT